MGVFVWPAEDGWPYPDPAVEVADHSADQDDDLVTVRADRRHLMEHLNSMEREVITACFGLDGCGERSMHEMELSTGLDEAQLRRVMGTGLAKLRADLR
jgi:DNA-directed RNA polymerase sigma subunit (sigma70/sigma32)